MQHIVQILHIIKFYYLHIIVYFFTNSKYSASFQFLIMNFLIRFSFSGIKQKQVDALNLLWLWHMHYLQSAKSFAHSHKFRAAQIRPANSAFKTSHLEKYKLNAKCKMQYYELLFFYFYILHFSLLIHTLLSFSKLFSFFFSFHWMPNCVQAMSLLIASALGVYVIFHLLYIFGTVIALHAAAAT